jgi:hypothetical protein
MKQARNRVQAIWLLRSLTVFWRTNCVARAFFRWRQLRFPIIRRSTDSESPQVEADLAAKYTRQIFHSESQHKMLVVVFQWSVIEAQRRMIAKFYAFIGWKHFTDQKNRSLEEQELQQKQKEWNNLHKEALDEAEITKLQQAEACHVLQVSELQLRCICTCATAVLSFG